MKVGIIGLGSMGLRHKQNFESLGCETLWYDPSVPDGIGPHTLVEEADAVVIASPSICHYEHIQMAHEAKKPMLVEKPVVMLRQQWETVPLEHVRMVGYNLRYRKCVQIAREWMGSGRAGKPLWARFTCGQHNCKPAYRHDGVVFNWSHEIDLSRHLLGSAEVLTSTCNKDETIADITLKHFNRCLTTIHLDYVTLPEQRDFIIVGEDGVIKVDIVQNSAYLLGLDGSILDDGRGSYLFEQDYRAEAKAFIDLVNGTLPVHQWFYCTAKEAMEVAGICLEVRENAAV